MARRRAVSFLITAPAANVNARRHWSSPSVEFAGTSPLARTYGDSRYRAAFANRTRIVSNPAKCYHWQHPDRKSASQQMLASGLDLRFIQHWVNSKRRHRVVVQFGRNYSRVTGKRCGGNDAPSSMVLVRFFCSSVL